MSTQPLLIEIGCEELPPKSLLTLACAFSLNICGELSRQDITFSASKAFLTPRRFSVLLNDVAIQQLDKAIQRKGPALNAAYDKDGNPTKAALGFAQSCGVAFDALEKLSTPQGEWLVFNANQKGVETLSLLPDIITQALHKLPIAKRMRWGSSTIEFVRPIHWVLGLLGEEVIPGEVFGIKPGNTTYGHRFHHPDAIEIKHPSEYEKALRNAKVEVDFDIRLESIRSQVTKAAQKIGGAVYIDDTLLEEVTALVEWPVALTGQFDKQFLDVPHEALVSTMTGNQKYFPVFDDAGKLLPYFIFVTNIESKDPQQIIAGNEKVIRPRFSDAQFFFEQDKKIPLEDLVERLKTIVFQKDLGTLHDKSQRIGRLLQSIGIEIKQSFPFGDAGILCKTDLMTSMVSEFPELQGTMGKYYALHQGKSIEIATAIEEHYLPRFSGDKLPTTPMGAVLALADRIDTLIGIFTIGQAPTGDKDPFALRRATIGIIRILVEGKISLDLKTIFDLAFDQIKDDISIIKKDKSVVVEEAIDFVLGRLQNIYQDQDISTETYLVTRAQNITIPLDFDSHIKAVHAVSELPEITSLASANKRIANILAKTDNSFVIADVKESELALPQEKQLYAAFSQVKDKTNGFTHSKNYKEALLTLAALKEPVDAFFDSVMVNAEDIATRNVRLNLLRQVRELFLSVADISLLSISK